METGDKAFQAGTGHHVRFVKCWQIFLELNSKRLCRSSGKEKERHYLVFTSSTERETKHFHFMLLFCQSKPFAFLPFSLTSSSSLLKLPNNRRLLRWLPPPRSRFWLARDASPQQLACVASVSVWFRREERPKNAVWLLFLVFCSETARKRLLRRLPNKKTTRHHMWYDRMQARAHGS